MSTIVFYPRRPSASRVWLRLLAAIAVLGLFGGWSQVAIKANAQETPALEQVTTHDAEHAEEGLPKKALPLAGANRISPTNSMIVTWLVALGIIIFAQYATRRMKDVPEGAQNFWEFLVESLYNFLESIVGKDLVKRTFWFFATVFIFILFTNWCGLIPGVGTIGWGHPNEQGALTHISRPLFRGANADLNMTLAMSLTFFACWIWWAISSNGIGGAIVHVFGNPARKEMKGALKVAMALIFIIVGLLEVVSILFRPVSLSFRLYGNIFAGENVLESMSHIFPPLAFLIPVPFYFMELLVGLVQALVFMLLTAVFTLLICSHDAHDDHAPGTGHH
jgi:F-type H+-transporting ATPase subunit a